jgi:hypothetical protein
MVLQGTSINQCVNQSMRQSIHQPIKTSLNTSINTSINHTDQPKTTTKLRAVAKVAKKDDKRAAKEPKGKSGSTF